jgi:hypothetical protein
MEPPNLRLPQLERLSLEPAESSDTGQRKMTEPSNVYQPIHEWQTRVLRLHAGRAEDALDAELHVASFTDADGFGVVGHGLIEYEG